MKLFSLLTLALLASFVESTWHVLVLLKSLHLNLGYRPFSTKPIGKL
jgi:hypothetical protein